MMCIKINCLKCLLKGVLQFNNNRLNLWGVSVNLCASITVLHFCGMWCNTEALFAAFIYWQFLSLSRLLRAINRINYDEILSGILRHQNFGLKTSTLCKLTKGILQPFMFLAVRRLFHLIWFIEQSDSNLIVHYLVLYLYSIVTFALYRHKYTGSIWPK